MRDKRTPKDVSGEAKSVTDYESVEVDLSVKNNFAQSRSAHTLIRESFSSLVNIKPA